MRKFNNKNRRSIKSTKGINKKNISSISIVFIFLVLCFLFFVAWKISALDKFIYVNRTEVGDAEIIIVDSQNNNVLKYKIDNDVELESAKGYGKYKLSSLWILSQKDEAQGGLITESFIKNYSIPVYLWKDGKKSNLSLLQLIKIRFINGDSKKITSSDYINFMDTYFSENVQNIEVFDMTGDLSVLPKVSKLLEVMGGKITMNSKGYDKDLDCEISGKNKRVVAYTNKIFQCKIAVSDNNAVDLSIKLGVKFADRF